MITREQKTEKPIKPTIAGDVSVTSSSSFFSEYFGEITQESQDKYERAFNARLAYEKNCIAKYDYPDNRPSKPPKAGDTMLDYAFRFGTTIQEMKEVEQQVERFLLNCL